MEWTTDKHKLDKSQNSYLEGMKSVSKDYILSDSIYMTFLERERSSDRE